MSFRFLGIGLLIAALFTVMPGCGPEGGTAGDENDPELTTDEEMMMEETGEMDEEEY